MDRFYVSPEEWDPERMVLRGDEARHCLRVMRKAPGDEIVVFDGRGRRAVGRLGEGSGGEVAVEVMEDEVRPGLRPQLVLLVAIPKGKTMDLIVQKAVELGVAVIQPLVTERTVVRLEERDRGRKREKWQRVALEACKQCGQDILPEVREPATLREALAGSDAPVKIMASLAEGARPFRAVVGELAEGADRVAVLIGPEGDFTAEETAVALEAGFQPVTLGEIVLRVETAALFCLGALRFWWMEE